MSENIIQNKLVEPSMKQILEFMDEYPRQNFNKIAMHLENNYKASPVVVYSRCSAMPGWNVKYKKSSKSFCTIYPDKEFFTVLLILKEEDMNKIKKDSSKYTKYFLDVMEKSGAMNGCKWLMVGIDDDDVLNDVLRAIDLKNQK
jgi:hypothetical protein